MKVLDLFGNEIEVRKKISRTSLFDQYDEFVDKFEAKKTTDDCYTPPEVYNTVLQWVRENVDIEGCNIVRPFYPGGDYQAEDYQPNDVVIDNPPFSIYTEIVRYYIRNRIRFFIFAPYLTIFGPKEKDVTYIPCGINITYENGAVVNTAFVSNLFPGCLAMSAPDLHKAIKIAREKKNADKVALPNYQYPDNIVRGTDLGKYSSRGIDFKIHTSDAVFISSLFSQRQAGKAIFGHGLLVSDKAAADKAAADKAAADKAAANKAIIWQLDGTEKNIIQKLNDKQI